MKTVNFTEMKAGTKEEYLLLDKYEKSYINGTADRILNFMKGLTGTLEGYKITRLEHSLQTATRAFKDKRVMLLRDELLNLLSRFLGKLINLYKNKIILKKNKFFLSFFLICTLKLIVFE